ncbi:hypothetical protein, partial [Escherichia coli]|uniref:hypothetical protein n=1 Tax=Escherichia coli TaxID=562 RepID=UPI001BFC0C94
IDFQKRAAMAKGNGILFPRARCPQGDSAAPILTILGSFSEPMFAVIISSEKGLACLSSSLSMNSRISFGISSS